MAEPTGGPGERVSFAFEPTARRRAGLGEAILALERAAERPAVGREQEWTAHVVEALGHLEAKIVEHIETTEAPDGLLNEIVEATPRLAFKVNLLRDEHPEMREATETLKESLVSVPAGAARPVAEVREEILQLADLLTRHRQLSSDLVWEAYHRDIGGEE